MGGTSVSIPTGNREHTQNRRIQGRFPYREAPVKEDVEKHKGQSSNRGPEAAKLLPF